MEQFTKIKSILRNKYLLLIFSQILILFVAIINRLPDGYIVSGGDTSQVINWTKAIHDLSYTWSMATSEGYFVSNFANNIYNVIIFEISSLFRINLSSQPLLFFAIFLSGAFWSFYFSIKIISDKYNKVEEFHKIIFALLYTFNIYTLQNFRGIWGYGPPFLFLYILIPLIFAYTFKYFEALSINKEIKSLAMLGILFSASNIANGNLAFFVALNIVLFCFICLIYLFYTKKIGLLKQLKYVFGYFALFWIATSWSVIPQIQEMFRLSSTFNNGQSIFDLRSWIMWQAARIPTVLFFSDPIYNISNVRFLTIFSGGIFLTLLILVSITKTINKKILLYGLCLIITFFLLNKGIGLLNENVIWAIFKNPILGSLRSYDKTAIFIPYFLLTIIYLLFSRQTKLVQNMILILLLSSILSVTTFFRGNIQTVYSQSHLKGQNYLTSKYSSLIKIPDDYYRVAKLLNQEKLLNRVITAPYSVINSVGWVNYPKWKLIGVDVTVQLFNKPTTQMNAYAVFGTWNYGQYWNNQPTEKSEWLLNLSGLLNSKYIFNHLDIDPKFIKDSVSKFVQYEKKGMVSLVDKNDYFSVYKIAEKYYLPHIYTPKKVIVTNEKVESLPVLLAESPDDNRQAIYFTENKILEEELSKIQNTGIVNPKIEYRQVSPVKFRVRVNGSSGKVPLVFSEAYNTGWKIYSGQSIKISEGSSLENYSMMLGNEMDQATKEELKQYLSDGTVTFTGNKKSTGIINFISKDIKDTVQNDNLEEGSIFETWFKEPALSESQHLLANGYANSWLIDVEKYCSKHQCVKNQNGTYSFEIIAEYWPQRQYYIFGGVSLFSLVVSISILIYYSKKR